MHAIGSTNHCPGHVKCNNVHGCDCIYFDIGENQFILNELPNDARHLIAVHFDDRLSRNESRGIPICRVSGEEEKEREKMKQLSFKN